LRGKDRQSGFDYSGYALSKVVHRGCLFSLFAIV
jgi:hypothetical protein